MSEDIEAAAMGAFGRCRKDMGENELVKYIYFLFLVS